MAKRRVDVEKLNNLCKYATKMITIINMLKKLKKYGVKNTQTVKLRFTPSGVEYCNYFCRKLTSFGFSTLCTSISHFMK